MSWLLLTGAWPWPVRRGLQARALELATILAEREAVTLLCPRPGRQAVAAPPGCGFRVETYSHSDLGVLSGLARAALSLGSMQSGLFAGRDLERRFRELAATVDRVLIQTVRFARLDFGVEPGRRYLDLIDSLSLNFAARARLDRPWLRPLWAVEARRLARDERRMIGASRGAAVVAGCDREHLRELLGPEVGGRVAVVPLVLAAGAAPPRRERRDPRFTLLVTGNLGYFPTRHGLDWFLREVWPEIRGERGAVRLLVAGSRPSASLARRLAAAGAELVREPPALAPFHAEADLALAPVFGGSGTSMKLLEAIAAGVPVLATPAAAAGLEAEVAAEVERASTAAEWVAAIENAARAREVWRARALRAREIALVRHSPLAVSDRFRRMVE